MRRLLLFGDTDNIWSSFDVLIIDNTIKINKTGELFNIKKQAA